MLFPSFSPASRVGQVLRGEIQFNRSNASVRIFLVGVDGKRLPSVSWPIEGVAVVPPVAAREPRLESNGLLAQS